jgi:Uma2 family endonuclease
MAVAQRPSLTLEQFLKLPETKPASEYQDGRITQKPLPKGKHSALQSEWTTRINQSTKPLRLGRAFSELRCTFAGRSIVPDVTYVAWDRIPREPSGAIADEFFLTPDLTVEILSPKQKPSDLTAKLRFCVANGCRMGLLIDPYAETVNVFRPDHPSETLTSGPVDLSPVIEGLALTVEEVFGWLK